MPKGGKGNAKKRKLDKLDEYGLDDKFENATNEEEMEKADFILRYKK